MAEYSFIDRFFKDNCGQLHGHTRKALLASTDSLMNGASLTLSSVGRRLGGEARTKHKIKRVDRLLGNSRLHGNLKAVYRTMIEAVLNARIRPVVLVDWSSFEHGNRWTLLRASVAVDGRSLTLLEHVHPIESYNSPQAHRALLQELKYLMPARCEPLIVTDAGFLGPWFKAVRALGWDFVGRLRGQSQLRLSHDGQWRPIKYLYTKASPRARCLGRAQCAKSAPYRADVHLVDETARCAKGPTLPHTYNEPWVLVSSLEPEHHRARQIVNIYRKRMQIELSFRDLKDDRWSMALVNARASTQQRREVLLLIAALATFCLWLIGLVAQTLNWQRHFQANTERKRRVLSLIFLGREVYRNPRYHLTEPLMQLALKLLALSTVDACHCR